MAEPVPTCATDDDHVWEWIETWEGDPSITNGTHQLGWWECSVCGATDDERDPPEHDDDDGGPPDDDDF